MDGWYRRVRCNRSATWGRISLALSMTYMPKGPGGWRTSVVFIARSAWRSWGRANQSSLKVWLNEMWSVKTDTLAWRAEDNKPSRTLIPCNTLRRGGILRIAKPEHHTSRQEIEALGIWDHTDFALLTVLVRSVYPMLVQRLLFLVFLHLLRLCMIQSGSLTWPRRSDSWRLRENV